MTALPAPINPTVEAIEAGMAEKSAEFADAANRVYLPIDATSGAATRS